MKRYLGEMADGGYETEEIGPFHRVMVPWLMRRWGIGTDARVLDIGAGQGHCLIPLAEAGFSDLLAADLDPMRFELFQEQYGMQTVRCDIETDRLDVESGSCDAVLCFHLIEHLSSPDNLMEEIVRVLREGGKAFVVTPNWRRRFRTFYRDPTHRHPYDKESIARCFRMFGLRVEVHSFETRFGVRWLQLYRWWKRLGMIGRSILAVGTKDRDPGS